MRIFLAGVTGYLGSHLAEALVAGGHEVVALKRRTSSLARIEHLSSKIKLFNLEEVDIYSLFEQCGKFDAVIHAITCYGRNGESASQIVEANLNWPIKLLDAAAASGIGLFLNADTVLDRLVSPYALSKGQFADWGRYFAKQSRIRFLNLRLEHFYGPKDDETKFTTHVLRACLSNAPELKLTLGEQMRDFIHIDDVVSAYLLVLEKQADFVQAFNDVGVGSGMAIRVRDFVKMVHDLTGSTTALNFGAYPYRAGESMFSQANTAQLKALGWLCRYDIEAGLKQVIEHEAGRSRTRS